MTIDAKPIALGRHQALAIKGWSQQFENAQSRRTKHLNYTVAPHQDQSFANQRVLTHASGYKALAIWHLIIQCAARCPQRGLLVDGSGPLSFAELAHRMHLPEGDVREAIAVLSDPKVRWIEVVDCPRHLVLSGSLRAGRKGRPRRPEVVEVESQKTGPAFYIEKCFTATVDIEGEEPTFEAERILPSEFEVLVTIAQKAKAAAEEASSVLEHGSDSVDAEGGAGETAVPSKAEIPDLSQLDFKSAINVLEHTPMNDIHNYVKAFSGVVRREQKRLSDS